MKFCKTATKYNLLLMPGSEFGCAGYMRIAYCAKFDMIKKSIPAFEALAKEFK